MKIPEKIKIGGKTYTVEITSKMDLGINNVSAEILYSDLIIRVSPQATAKMEADFIHEMVHAIYFGLGYRDHDEKRVDELANALHSVIVDLDAHITRITAKSRAATWAEKIAARFKLDREDLVVKNSYMYCDALDMCFFFLNGRTPAFAYAGYTVVRSADANGGLVKAFAKADEVLRYMAEYQEKEAATQ